MIRSKQACYESFLDAQQDKQQTRWFRDVPAILQGLTKVIQELKTILAEKANYEAKSLPKLREYYKVVMDAQNGKHDYAAYLASKEAISSMTSQINSWFRSSNVAVGIKAHTDHAYYGHAQIAEKFELLVSNSFEVTTNRV
jgi:hypothetical protein